MSEALPSGHGDAIDTTFDPNDTRNEHHEPEVKSQDQEAMNVLTESDITEPGHDEHQDEESQNDDQQHDCTQDDADQEPEEDGGEQDDPWEQYIIPRDQDAYQAYYDDPIDDLGYYDHFSFYDAKGWFLTAPPLQDEDYHPETWDEYGYRDEKGYFTYEVGMEETAVRTYPPHLNNPDGPYDYEEDDQEPSPPPSPTPAWYPPPSPEPSFDSGLAAALIDPRSGNTLPDGREITPRTLTEEDLTDRQRELVRFEGNHYALGAGERHGVRARWDRKCDDDTCTTLEQWNAEWNLLEPQYLGDDPETLEPIFSQQERPFKYFKIPRYSKLDDGYLALAPFNAPLPPLNRIGRWRSSTDELDTRFLDRLLAPSPLMLIRGFSMLPDDIKPALSRYMLTTLSQAVHKVVRRTKAPLLDAMQVHSHWDLSLYVGILLIDWPRQFVDVDIMSIRHTLAHNNELSSRNFRHIVNFLLEVNELETLKSVEEVLRVLWTQYSDQCDDADRLPDEKCKQVLSRLRQDLKPERFATDFDFILHLEQEVQAMYGRYRLEDGPVAWEITHFDFEDVARINLSDTSQKAVWSHAMDIARKYGYETSEEAVWSHAMAIGGLAKSIRSSLAHYSWHPLKSATANLEYARGIAEYLRDEEALRRLKDLEQDHLPELQKRRAVMDAEYKDKVLRDVKVALPQKCPIHLELATARDHWERMTEVFGWHPDIGSYHSLHTILRVDHEAYETQYRKFIPWR